MLIELSVTPRAVAPFAVPGPHTFFKVAKVPGWLAAVDADDPVWGALVAGVCGGEDERPQPASPRDVAATNPVVMVAIRLARLFACANVDAFRLPSPISRSEDGW
jgi:hypothetical protein